MDNTQQLPAEMEAQIKKEALETLTRASRDLKYSAGYFDGYCMGATEYATKLHPVEQENTQLKRWKMEAVELLTPINAYVHKNIEKSLGQSSVKLVLDRCNHFEQASALLTEVLMMNEMWGDLPGEYINKVKTFLDGTK